jgi:hypothetical protein
MDLPFHSLLSGTVARPRVIHNLHVGLEPASNGL